MHIRLHTRFFGSSSGTCDWAGVKKSSVRSVSSIVPEHSGLKMGAYRTDCDA